MGGLYRMGVVVKKRKHHVKVRCESMTQEIGHGLYNKLCKVSFPDTISPNYKNGVFDTCAKARRTCGSSLFQCLIIWDHIHYIEEISYNLIQGIDIDYS